MVQGVLSRHDDTNGMRPDFKHRIAELHLDTKHARIRSDKLIHWEKFNPHSQPPIHRYTPEQSQVKVHGGIQLTWVLLACTHKRWATSIVSTCSPCGGLASTQKSTHTHTHTHTHNDRSISLRQQKLIEHHDPNFCIQLIDTENTYALAYTINT